MGKFNTFVLVSSFIAFVHCAGAVSDDYKKANELIDKGEFKSAAGVLSEQLNKGGLSESEKESYQWKLEWMERVRQDYSFTEDQLFKKLSGAVKGLTKEEFTAWLKEGQFDYRVIDGQKRYVGTSVSNLFWRHSDLESRRQPAKDLAAYHTKLLNTVRRVKTAVSDTQSPYVFPTKFNCTMTVTADANAATNGEVVRAWLPIPRAHAFQKDFKLLGSSSPVQYLSDDDSLIRSVYLEQKAVKDAPTKFQVKYQYVRNGIYFDMQPEKVQTGPVAPELKRFTEEAPHVVFTPELKALASQIVKDEKNPLLQAKAFYNWISENIKYSYSREYSTLTNISDYCRSNNYGDCGQEGLLFITLCRSRGIPARWQSGWNLFPTQKGIHDWTEIYLAPYGWVPVDPWAGIYAIRYCTTLDEEERKEVRDFYFGGLDQYRMSANSDHSQKLQPPKKNFRSDDVDFQRGELEAAKNIYFDQYNYELKVEESPVSK